MQRRSWCAGLLVLIACGGGGGSDDTGDDSPDDARPVVDGPPGAIDGPALVPDAAAGCAAYCAQIATACSDSRVQFATEADCLGTCSTWRAGEAGDMIGNSLACRVYHAGLAMTDPAAHCLHAGPSGDGQCGVACTGLCSILDHVCTGANQQYATHSACHQTCVTWATDPPYSANVTSGDSFACRMSHATAATTSPSTQCPNTAAVSAACQ